MLSFTDTSFFVKEFLVVKYHELDAKLKYAVLL